MRRHLLTRWPLKSFSGDPGCVLARSRHRIQTITMVRLKLFKSLCPLIWMSPKLHRRLPGAISPPNNIRGLLKGSERKNEISLESYGSAFSSSTLGFYSLMTHCWRILAKKCGQKVPRGFPAPRDLPEPSPSRDPPWAWLILRGLLLFLFRWFVLPGQPKNIKNAAPQIYDFVVLPTYIAD